WSLPSDVTTLSAQNAALGGKLVHRQAQCLASNLLVDTGDLEHHASRLDIGDPPLDGTLARAHADLGRLLGERSIGVDVDEHLAATLHVAGHGDTCGLDLAVGDVGRLESLEAVVAERELGAALGQSAAGRVVLLAVLGPAGDQRVAQASVPGCCAGACCWAGAAAGGSVALVATAAGTLGAGAASAGAGTLRRGLLGRELPGGHVALVDPHLHADAAEGGAGLVEAVIDVRPQSVQRHAPLAVELAAAHLGAAETAGDGHTDALGAGTLRGLHALAHRPAERHASSEL